MLDGYFVFHTLKIIFDFFTKFIDKRKGEHKICIGRKWCNMNVGGVKKMLSKGECAERLCVRKYYLLQISSLQKMFTTTFKKTSMQI